MQSPGQETKVIGQIPPVGVPAPDFSGQSVLKDLIEDMQLKQFRGKYLVLLFYSQDFLPQCPTELRSFSEAIKEFKNLKCEIVGCSTDSVFVHLAWTNLAPENGGLGEIEFPLLGDKTYEICKNYGILKTDGCNFQATFIIDDRGILRHVTVNDKYVVRSVEETKRMVALLQKIDKEERAKETINAELAEKQKVSKSPNSDRKAENDTKSSGKGKMAEKSPNQEAPDKAKSAPQSAKVDPKVDKATKTESKADQKAKMEAKADRKSSETEAKSPKSDGKQTTSATGAKGYDVKLIPRPEVPPTLKGGMKVTIDRTDQAAGDKITVATGDTVRAVLVKKGKEARVIKTEGCTCSVGPDKETIKLGNFQLIIQHLESPNESQVLINDVLVRRITRGNRNCVSLEMSSTSNHFVCVNGECLFFKSEHSVTSRNEVDYTAVEDGAKVICLYKNITEK